MKQNGRSRASWRTRRSSNASSAPAEATEQLRLRLQKLEEQLQQVLKLERYEDAERIRGGAEELLERRDRGEDIRPAAPLPEGYDLEAEWSRWPLDVGDLVKIEGAGLRAVAEVAHRASRARAVVDAGLRFVTARFARERGGFLSIEV